MCGILGWFARTPLEGAEGRVRAALDAQKHRGPDGEGVRVFWSAKRPGQSVMLAHSRLSIIDLTGGAQPFSSACGRYTIVFNGEIYNYIELRDALSLLGIEFLTDSDTEVLLHCYIKYGRECLSRLRGMFAFIIYDNQLEEIFFARDVFGKKPLYIFECDGNVYLSSEISPIQFLSEVPFSLDQSAIPQYLVDRYSRGPQTYFVDIRKVPPGHYGYVSEAGTTQMRYGIDPFVRSARLDKKSDELAPEFKRIFEEAVEIRLRSDAPFGAFLSGGLDSSVIVASMKRLLGQPVRTFSAAFDDPSTSEGAYAARVAEHLRCEHHEKLIGPEEFAEAWPRAVRFRGAPVAQPADVCILLLSEMAREHVKMVLTGEGADELLAGYPKYWAEHRFERVLNFASIISPFLTPLAPVVERRSERLGVLLRVLAGRNASERAEIWFSSMSDEVATELLVDPPGWKRGWEGAPLNADGARVNQAYDYQFWLPDNLLERGDRMMMGGSIEGRMPFMDVDLTKFVAEHAKSLQFGRRRPKQVLRDLYHAELPEDILARPKRGFPVPVGAWFRGPLRSFLETMLLSDDTRIAAFVRQSRLRSFVTLHQEGSRNFWREIWTLVNLEMFLREFELSRP